jgi:uncharacterized protein with HEPN domain
MLLERLVEKRDDIETVWEIVQRDVPKLKSAITVMLDEL